MNWRRKPPGPIAPSERALLERYLRVGNFLNLIHAKARCALAEPTFPSLVTL